MNYSPSGAIRKIELETRIQYGLMILFGTLCLGAALAPLPELTKVAVVATLFGFTAGLWVSHLVQRIQVAVERNAARADS